MSCFDEIGCRIPSHVLNTIINWIDDYHGKLVSSCDSKKSCEPIVLEI